MTNPQQESYAKEVFEVPFEEEMKQSYLDYAMSVLVGRALPDARDGLKPVHRRVMFSMDELSNHWNKAYKKSARIVGDTIGKYHPHGDTAVYDTMVRMAQPFSLRYCLIDGQGNFGSVDGDSPAAMRYTEVRLSKIAHHLLLDLDKDTVDFGPNYDGSEKEPLVLPTRLPNLLLNGSEGIAVGMATKIPPHNLNELIEGCLKIIADKETTVDELIKIIPAPDFPTGGIICGTAGAQEAYKTGKGSLIIRAKTHFEEMDNDRTAIVVDELPYQVNKRVLQERIADLVNDKKIEGISNIQDESDKSGMRLVIELKRGEIAEVILNQLYKNTDLQISYGINMVALENGRPVLLNLRDALTIFIDHRKEVITRRTIHELKVMKIKGHVLEGLAVALSNVDEIVSAIKTASNPQQAKEVLLGRTWPAPLVKTLRSKMKISEEDASWPEGVLIYNGLKENNQYQLSEKQVQEILQLRLQKLTGLEQESLNKEYEEVLTQIDYLLDILMHASRVLEICARELEEVRAQFGDERKSQISFGQFNIDDEDLIPKRERLVTLSVEGYIKTADPDDFERQNRGGRGKSSGKLKQEDQVRKVFVANSHDTLLCFTSKGRVLPIKIYALPEGSRQSKGRPLVNFLNLGDETVSEVLPIKEFTEDQFLIFLTKGGVIKKTSLNDFKTIRSGGLNAIYIQPEDELIAVGLAKDHNDIMLFSDNNRMIRFSSNELRDLSRSAQGVRAMNTQQANMIGLVVAENEEDEILTITELGYAKRTEVGEYRKIKRGGMGVNAIPSNEKIGTLKKVLKIQDNTDVLGITNDGVMIRVGLDQIRKTSRTAQGVRLMKLLSHQKLMDVCEVWSDKASNELGDECIEEEDVHDGNDGENSHGI